MKGFNLAKFKKMKEDKNWATLIHEDGHELNIAKAPLSPIQRKQLEQLAMHRFAQGGKVMHYAEGTDNAQFDPSAPEANSSTQPDPADPANLTAAPPSSDDGSSSPPPSPPDRTPASGAIAAPAATPQNALVGLQEEQAANTALAQAQASQAQNEVKAYEDAQDQADALPTANDIVQKYQQSGDALLKAYQDQKIDPAAYWNDHSKVAAGIGVLLSGLGQAVGAGHVQSNGALDMIENGVNREIALQKNSQDKALNLYKLNRAALGDDLSANLATQNQLYTGLKYSIAKAAAQAGTPIALANGQIANAKIDQMIGKNNQDLAAFQSNSPQDYPEPEIKLRNLILRGRIPPAVGDKIAEEIKNRRDIASLTPKIIAAHDLAEQEVNHGAPTPTRGIIPGTTSPAQDAFEGLINTTIKEKEGTARAAAFKAIHDTQTPSPLDHTQNARDQRRQLTADYLQANASAPLSKTYGIDLDQYPSTKIVIPPRAQVNPNVQYERRIINGKAYQVPVGAR